VSLELASVCSADKKGYHPVYRMHIHMTRVINISFFDIYPKNLQRERGLGSRLYFGQLDPMKTKFKLTEKVKIFGTHTN
jgi:hypothetical protein